MFQSAAGRMPDRCPGVAEAAGHSERFNPRPGACPTDAVAAVLLAVQPIVSIRGRAHARPMRLHRVFVSLAVQVSIRGRAHARPMPRCRASRTAGNGFQSAAGRMPDRCMSIAGDVAAMIPFQSAAGRMPDRCKHVRNRGKSVGNPSFFPCVDSARSTLCIMCRRHPTFPT